jgi:hypothetical protein
VEELEGLRQVRTFYRLSANAEEPMCGVQVTLNSLVTITAATSIVHLQKEQERQTGRGKRSNDVLIEIVRRRPTITFAKLPFSHATPVRHSPL